MVGLVCFSFAMPICGGQFAGRRQSLQGGCFEIRKPVCPETRVDHIRTFFPVHGRFSSTERYLK